jgi:hypothetical protein
MAIIISGSTKPHCPKTTLETMEKEKNKKCCDDVIHCDEEEAVGFLLRRNYLHSNEEQSQVIASQ